MKEKSLQDELDQFQPWRDFVNVAVSLSSRLVIWSQNLSVIWVQTVSKLIKNEKYYTQILKKE